MSLFDVNRTELSGNLTADPELKYSQEGRAMLKFRFAHNERQKVDGEWTDVPMYFGCTVFGPEAETLNNNLKKGTKVLVFGRLEPARSYEKDGKTNFAQDIVAREVTVMGAKGSADGASGGAAPARSSGGRVAAEPDSDLPF